jgi:transposase
MAHQPGCVTGGVDTHKDVHVAAVIDERGKVLDTAQFETNVAGYRRLLDWMRSFGELGLVGVEGTGAYGAGLARHLTAHGVSVVEVNRPNRQLRRQRGKSDTVDAEAAARAALNGEATVVAKSQEAVVESIRVLRIVFTSARRDRSRVILQVRDLIVTAPEQLRAALASLPTAERMARCARFRITGPLDDPGEGTKLALRTLARRYLTLSAEIRAVAAELDDLTGRANPDLRSVKGIGSDVASILLVAVGDNAERLKSEGAFAAMCGVSPLEASSGKVTRHRLNRSGNRQANHALWRVAIVRMHSDERTKRYVERRTQEGKSRREIIRCLKRYIAREVFQTLTHPQAVPLGHAMRAMRTDAGISLETAAAALGTWSVRLSRLERAVDFNRELAERYQGWLTGQIAA